MLDLDALVNQAVSDQFAEVVTYNPLASAPSRAAFATRGTFDKDHEVIFEEIAQSENNAPGHSTFVPMLGVRTVELELEPKKGDRVTIRGTLYQVYDVHPEGDGWAELILKKIV